MSNTHTRLDGDRRMIRLSDDAYVFGSYPFAGLVTTDEGSIAIDGPMSPRNCEPWKAFIDGQGPLRFQVYCEHHQDHTASAPYLRRSIDLGGKRSAVKDWVPGGGY